MSLSPVLTGSIGEFTLSSPGTVITHLQRQIKRPGAPHPPFIFDEFPNEIGGNSNSLSAADSTTHTLFLGTGILPGHLLLAWASFDGNPTITGFTEAGWTRLAAATAPSNAAKLEAWYRVADGTENGNDPSVQASIPLTSSAAEQFTGMVRVVEGHGSSTRPPVATISTGSSQFPLPPSLSPSASFSGDKMLWYEAFGADDDDLDNAFASLNPAFHHVTQIESSATDNSCMLALAERALSTGTMSPTQMSMSLAEEWVATTIAVYPGQEGQMLTFPRITSGVSSSLGTAGTAHTASLPNFVSGNLLLAFFTVDGNPTITWPGGWTALVPDTPSGTAVKTGVRYRYADGSEGNSIILTTSAAGESVHHAYAVTNHDPSIAPQMVVQTGTGTAMGCSGSLVPTGGLKHYLWMVGFGADDDDEDTERRNDGHIVVYYERFFQKQSSQTATSCMQAVGNQRIALASKATTSHFFLGASQEWVSFLIAIHPDPSP